jgi:hypothetical protein
VRLGCRTDQPLQGGLGQARGERIGRNPVGTFGKERPAVDHKGKGAPPGVRLLPQLDRAQAQLIGLFVQDDPRAQELHPNLVERLIPPTVWPPELRILDLHGEGSPGRGRQRRADCVGRPVRRGHQQKRRKPGDPVLHRQARLHGDGASGVSLAEVDVRKAGGFKSLQADLFPDADRRELRPPIPAELAGRLPQVRPARKGLRDAGQGADRLLRGGKAHGGVKADAQVIPFRLEQGLDVKAILAEHVRRAAQLAAVQADGRQGIQPVAHQPGVRLLQEIGRDGKSVAILPIRLGHPLHAPLMVAHKGVGDAAQGQQIGVRPAGDGRGPPFFRTYLAKFPGAAQGLNVH